MKEFEPRPFQKEVFEKLKNMNPQPSLHWGGRRFVGVDIGAKEGDNSVIVHGIPDKNGGFKVIAIDEFSTFPSYKWYRNPIKWWNLRRLWRRIGRNSNYKINIDLDKSVKKDG